MVGGEMRYKDLIVWQKSMDLVEEVYALASHFPTEERFALWSQIVRAAVSVPSNIAEGSGRATQKEFLHFLSIARGSLYELSTQLTIAQRLGYIADFSATVVRMNEIARILTAMMKKKS